MTIRPYFELYRVDVALLSLLSYLVGVLLSSGATTTDAIAGLLISCISFNFIYSLNSWSDREIDKINKSHRPIPSGRLSTRNAFWYSMFLLAVSLIYPLLLTQSPSERLLFWMFPLVGIVYSVKPLRIRRYAIPSVLLISTMYAVPVLLGSMRHGALIPNLPFSISLFIYALAIVPLKDIEDQNGDARLKVGNWSRMLPGDRLFGYSITMHCIGCTLAVMTVDTAKWFLFTHYIISMTFLTGYRLRAGSIRKVYGNLLRVVVCNGLALTAIWVVTRR